MSDPKLDYLLILTAKLQQRVLRAPSRFRLCPTSYLVLLFASLLTIPLARQCCFDAPLFAGFEVVGVTLDFLDDVLLLDLALKPAQSVFERFAFLNANLCQSVPPPNLPKGLSI